MMDCVFMNKLIFFLILEGFAEASIKETRKEDSHEAMDSLKVHDK